MNNPNHDPDHEPLQGEAGATPPLNEETEGDGVVLPPEETEAEKKRREAKARKIEKKQTKVQRAHELKLAGIPQSRIARELHVSPTTISRWVSDVEAPALELPGVPGQGSAAPASGLADTQVLRQSMDQDIGMLSKEFQTKKLEASIRSLDAKSGSGGGTSLSEIMAMEMLFNRMDQMQEKRDQRERSRTQAPLTARGPSAQMPSGQVHMPGAVAGYPSTDMGLRSEVQTLKETVVQLVSSIKDRELEQRDDRIQMLEAEAQSNRQRIEALSGMASLEGTIKRAESLGYVRETVGRGVYDLIDKTVEKVDKRLDEMGPMVKEKFEDWPGPGPPGRRKRKQGPGRFQDDDEVPEYREDGSHYSDEERQVKAAEVVDRMTLAVKRADSDNALITAGNAVLQNDQALTLDKRMASLGEVGRRVDGPKEAPPKGRLSGTMNIS